MNLWCTQFSGNESPRSLQSLAHSVGRELLVINVNRKTERCRRKKAKKWLGWGLRVQCLLPSCVPMMCSVKNTQSHTVRVHMHMLWTWSWSRRKIAECWSSAGEINDVKPPDVLARGHSCNFLFMRSLTFFFPSHSLAAYLFPFLDSFPFFFSICCLLFCSPCVCMSTRASHLMPTAPSTIRLIHFHFQGLEIRVSSVFLVLFFHLQHTKKHQNIVEPKESNKIRVAYSPQVKASTSLEKKRKMIFANVAWNGQKYDKHHSKIYNVNI